MTPHQLPPDLKREVEEEFSNHVWLEAITEGATWMYSRMKCLEVALERFATDRQFPNQRVWDDDRMFAQQALEEFRKGR